MAIKAAASFLICIVFLLPLCLLVSSISAADCNPMCKVFKPYQCNDPNVFSASSFPPGFKFGGSSSAYQIEGAYGRGPNIWDSFTHKYADKPSMSKDNGDVGAGSYHNYKDDVQMLVQMGANAYRFSFAWSRLMLRGKRSDHLFDEGINEEGVAYYNDLIDELQKYGIEPFVTLFHWDLPQYLEDDYGGFVNRQIVSDYVNYADLCFERFGNRVKNWITLNQPYSYAYKGHGDGTYPPHRCSRWMGKGCVGGDSSEEPYEAAHNQILAHAYTVQLYRTKYKKAQNGQIGTTLITRWFEPYDSTSDADIEATERSFDFLLGWFLEPMTRGDYPQVMRKRLGNRLPKFTPKESNEIVRNSLDFLGINYYVAQYVINVPVTIEFPSVMTDPGATLTYIGKDGQPIGEALGFPGVYAHPLGLKNILNYIKVKYFDKYGKKPVYITENGYISDGNEPLEDILRDGNRTDYHCSHLSCIKCAIENDPDLEVKGYFAWSNLDNYEFLSGFSVRFGMNYVDFNNVKNRQPKDSAKWFANFNRNNEIPKLLQASI